MLHPSSFILHLLSSIDRRYAETGSVTTTVLSSQPRVCHTAYYFQEAGQLRCNVGASPGRISRRPGYIDAA